MFLLNKRKGTSIAIGVFVYLCVYVCFLAAGIGRDESTFTYLLSRSTFLLPSTVFLIYYGRLLPHTPFPSQLFFCFVFIRIFYSVFILFFYMRRSKRLKLKWMANGECRWIISHFFFSFSLIQRRQQLFFHHLLLFTFHYRHSNFILCN